MSTSKSESIRVELLSSGTKVCYNQTNQVDVDGEKLGNML